MCSEENGQGHTWSEDDGYLRPLRTCENRRNSTPLRLAFGYVPMARKCCRCQYGGYAALFFLPAHRECEVNVQLCERALFSRSDMVSTPLTTLVFVLLPLYCWCASPTVATSLAAANLDGLKSQFQAAMKSFSDIESLHYTLAGIKELGVQPPESYCNDIKRLVDKSSVESIYHATEAAKAINNCKVGLDQSTETCTSAARHL